VLPAADAEEEEEEAEMIIGLFHDVFLGNLKIEPNPVRKQCFF
jgi:hypothetical protein